MNNTVGCVLLRLCEREGAGAITALVLKQPWRYLVSLYFVPLRLKVLACKVTLHQLSVITCLVVADAI